MSGKPVPLLLLAALICALAGCGASADPFDTSRKDESVEVAKRPKVEAILAKYRSFQVDLLGELDAHFGNRRWYAFSKLESGVCDGSEPKDGQMFSLPAMTFDGSYPAQNWDRVRDLVIQIGKKHGFGHVTVIADRPNNLTLVGHDVANDGQYYFALGANAVLGINTGCLLWGATPHATP